MNSLRPRLEAAQSLLGLKNQEMAAQLRITPEWYSKIVNGKVAASEDIGLRLDELLRRKNIEPSSIADRASVEVFEAAASYPAGTDRRRPSSRIDCEDYFRLVLNTAEASEDPDAFPAIMSRLKKQFPLDEWGTTVDADAMLAEARAALVKAGHTLTPLPHKATPRAPSASAGKSHSH